MGRIIRYASILICISLFIGFSAASEHNISESETVSSEHSFNFETVDSAETSENFEYEVVNDSVNMNGVVEMTDQCHELEANIIEDGEQYIFEVAQIDTSEENLDCGSELEPKGFEASFSATTPYEIVAFIDGEEEPILVDGSDSEPETDRAANETNQTSDETSEAMNEADEELNETDMDETEEYNDSLNQSEGSDEELNDLQSESDSSKVLENETRSDSEADEAPENNTEALEGSENDNRLPLNSSDSGESVENDSEEDIVTEDGVISEESDEESSGLQGAISSALGFIGSLIPGR